MGGGVGTGVGTPGGGGILCCWVYVLRMVHSALMGVSCSSVGAGVAWLMALSIACEVCIILSLAVKGGVARLWGWNLMALLMITALDFLVRTL